MENENDAARYYPDLMSYDQKTNTLTPSKNLETDKKSENLDENSKKNQNSAQFFENFIKNAQNENPITKILGGNLENFLNKNNGNNNLFAQTLSSLLDNKKTPEHKSFSFDSSDFFEEF